MEPLECADWCWVWEKEEKSNMLRNFDLKYWEKRDLTIIQISCSFKSLHGLSLASFLKNRALKSHTTHSCILIFHLCQVLISELSHILFLWPETPFLFFSLKTLIIPGLLVPLVNVCPQRPLNPFCPFPFRVDISEDGMKALVTLSSGDMRRALNILQVQCYSQQISGGCFGRVFQERDKQRHNSKTISEI